MLQRAIQATAVTVLVFGAALLAAPVTSLDSTRTTGGGPPAMWTLKCAAFDAGAKIPKRHTGDGEDVSPALAWAAPPAGTKELVLVVDDPDAPSPDPWVHWVLYKIPAKLTSLPEGIPPTPSVTTPPGVLQGKNSWGGLGWRGPSPPRGHGVHHYHFKLYALDAPMPDRAGLDKRAVLGAMKGHVLSEAEIVGTYER